jgi:3-methyladenine DNA glycosylase/8-oxoguanine DNA glycosylase
VEVLSPTLYDDRTRRRAVAHLRAADPALASVIARVGRCRFAPRAEGTHFDALVRAVIYQQLSGKAAATIHARVEGLYGGRPPAPSELVETPDADLRAAGLSRQKLGYLKDLAEHVESGALPVDGLDALGDDDVLDALTAVKGVGRWTAQMFLMFRLGRPDVLPELDLGVRKGVQQLHGLDELPAPREVTELGEAWRPYRTIASWYLWRSLES